MTKTREELEEKILSLKLFFIILFGLLISGISMFAIVLFNTQHDSLETQLSECQDKVPVWTLNASCDIFFNTIDERYELTFDNYKDYLTQRERFENTKGCEIIK